MKTFSSASIVHQILPEDVLMSPVITEKASLVSLSNQVLFTVAKTANKKQIQEAVEKLFNVKVRQINTLRRKGKRILFRGKTGKQKDIKRAFVSLVEGHVIDVSGF